MMTDKNTDIDYENMDDLPLTHRVEWNYFQIDEDIFKAMDSEHVALQAS